jgi:hypothetical protein
MQMLIMGVLLWIVTCSLALVLFRYNPVTYWKSICQTTCVMMFVTLAIQWSGFSFLAPIIQPILGIIFFKIFMKFKWVNSAIMILFSYEICRTIEVIYVFIQTRYHIKESIQIFKNIPKFGDALILVFLVIVFILYLHISKIGFTFICRYRSFKVPTNIVLLSAAVIAILLLSISLSIVVSHNYFFVIPRIIAMLLLLYFLYASYRKEMRDDF